MADLFEIDFGDGVSQDLRDASAVKWAEAASSVKKNLLKNTASTQTINGVTFTVNADKSVTFGGDSTGAQLYLNTELHLTPNTAYILSTGTPVTNDQINIRIGNSSDSYIGNTAASTGLCNFTSPADGIVKIRINVGSGINITTPITFYPMIRLASIADSAYAPWIPDNTELVPWSANALTGVHNFLSPDARSITISGLTITAYEDGRVTFNGTYTGNSFYSFKLCSTAKLANLKNINLKMRLDGQNVPSALQIQSFKIDGTNTRSASSNTDTDILVTQSGIDISNSGMFLVVGAALKDVQIDNLTVYTMIRLASDTDTTYQPYAMTNRELTTKVQGILDAAANAADFAAFKTALGNL